MNIEIDNNRSIVNRIRFLDDPIDIAFAYSEVLRNPLLRQVLQSQVLVWSEDQYLNSDLDRRVIAIGAPFPNFRY